VNDGALRVFYDGECGMCSRVIAWALARDTDGRLRPEPLQSEAARAALGEHAARANDELHVWSEESGMRVGADAMAELLRRLPRWRWLGALIGFPLVLPLARPAYRWVAKRRGWSGVQNCPLPPSPDAK